MDRSPHLAVLRRLVPSTVAPRDTEAMLRHTLRSLTRLTGHELSSLGPGDIELAIARHVIGLHGGTLARRDAGGEAWHEVILELPTLLGAA